MFKKIGITSTFFSIAFIVATSASATPSKDDSDFFGKQLFRKTIERIFVPSSGIDPSASTARIAAATVVSFLMHGATQECIRDMVFQCLSEYSDHHVLKSLPENLSKSIIVFFVRDFFLRAHWEQWWKSHI